MEIKFHGHSCFELSEGETTRPGRPVPEAEQPGRGGDRRGGRADPHRDHPRPRRPHRRRRPGRQADRRPLRRDRRARQLARTRRASRRSATRTSAARSSSTGAGSSSSRPGTRTRSPAPKRRPSAPSTASRSAPPPGLVINIGETTVYHAGDTCLFSDMKLIAERNPVDVALLPIGGHYTMDRHDAVVAAEFVGADDGDPDALRHLPADRDRRRRLQGRGRGRRPPRKVVVLEPGRVVTTASIQRGLAEQPGRC